MILPGDTIICADSGYDHALRMGIKPDLVLGDMDSVRHEPACEKVERFPAEKDWTDTELAVRTAVSQGFTTLLLLAASGSRWDHMLANFLLLEPLQAQGIQAEIANEYNRMTLITEQIALHGQLGELVSLVPITCCTGVTTQGLYYPLQQETLPPGTSRGVSNYFVTPNASVSLSTGKLLVIQSKDR